MVGLGGTASVGEDADIIILLWGDLLLTVEVLWRKEAFWVGPYWLFAAKRFARWRWQFCAFVFD
jgi:hypothetical protein